VDSRGDGEFSAAIRCGLLHGKTASLYAGCGIVASSDPESEFDETNIKFRPMLDALAMSEQLCVG
jgi:menaquinone-specific isochorismate synthase